MIDQYYYLKYIKELMSYFNATQVRNMQKATEVGTYTQSYLTRFNEMMQKATEVGTYTQSYLTRFNEMMQKATEVGTYTMSNLNRLNEIQATMLNSPVVREYQDMLRDINDLPTTYVCTIYDIYIHNKVKNERSRHVNQNFMSFQQKQQPYPNEDNDVDESNTEALYINAFIKGYACAKMKDLKILREIKNDVRYSEHKELLQKIEDQWIEGNIVSSPLMRSPYHMHRIVGTPDAIKNKDFTRINQQNEKLKEINLKLQVTISEMQQQKCETMFKDLPEIAQLGYDPQKVSLKLDYEPWEAIDDRKLANDGYEATKIYISYEGVNDKGECKDLSMYNGPCRIRDAEKKLLIKLAFYQDDAVKLEKILADSKPDCVAHLNSMYNAFFNLKTRSNFIDKMNGILKVKLDYKRPKSFE